jgi:hypothetical protein
MKAKGTVRIESTQIRWFSGTQAEEAGLREQSLKDTGGKSLTQVELPGSQLLRSDDSCGGQAVGLDLVSGGQRCSRRCQKTTSDSQGTK